MNRLAFWLLIGLCVAVEVWGLVIDNRDVHYLGAIAGFGVVGVNYLLLRADEDEAGEEV
ncbi:hypothetical protein [Streptomyces sp. NPDC058667]|uniref:hypothetical protein n=1 Tax=Streptomyces sp. NPDC058667 TaxID=3346588 RepID=UPI003647EA93